jgi:hypothetical protein
MTLWRVAEGALLTEFAAGAGAGAAGLCEASGKAQTKRSASPGRASRALNFAVRTTIFMRLNKFLQV